MLRAQLQAAASANAIPSINARLEKAASLGLLQVSPVSLHLGALIGGVDLKQELNPAHYQAIYDALVRYKVIFFQAQNLDHAQQVQLSKKLAQASETVGGPTIGHTVFGHVEQYPEVYSVAKNRTANSGRTGTIGTVMTRPWTGWHTDITAAVNPPSISILRGVTIPPYGGDTHWTNLAAAYEGLSDAMKGFLGGLRGRHQMNASAAAQSEYAAAVNNRTMITDHPLITVHPDTLEKVLFVSPGFLRSIPALKPRESEQLLEMLWEHAVRPEYTVRYKWSVGDVAIWDNRATSHLAPVDIFETDFDRQLYRVTLVGKPLQGVDGQFSESIKGGPIPTAEEELAAGRKFNIRN